MEKAKKDCENKQKLSTKNNSLFCPFYFDGILCWEQTKYNTIAYQNCPTYVVGFVNIKEYATIFCTSNGTWEKKKGQMNKTYTNYENCILADKDEELLLVILMFTIYTKLLKCY